MARRTARRSGKGKALALTTGNEEKFIPVDIWNVSPPAFDMMIKGGKAVPVAGQITTVHPKAYDGMRAAGAAVPVTGQANAEQAEHAAALAPLFKVNKWVKTFDPETGAFGQPRLVTGVSPLLGWAVLGIREGYGQRSVLVNLRTSPHAWTESEPGPGPGPGPILGGDPWSASGKAPARQRKRR